MRQAIWYSMFAMFMTFPPGAVADTQWTVDTVPIVDIAGTAPNGDLVFETAAGATRLSNGTMVVADGTGAAVRFFDATGQLQRTVGRSGSAPGEFRLVSWLGKCGADTIFVWDFMQIRFTVIDGVGNVVRQYRVPDKPADGPPPATISCSSTGVFAFLARPSNPRPPRSGRRFARYRSKLTLADTQGRVTRTVGEVPAGEIASAFGNWTLRPLGKFASIAVSADYLYVGTADSAFVDVYSLDGHHLAALPINIQPRSPTALHYERAIDAQLMWQPEADIRERLKERLLELPMPGQLPPYSGLFTDPDGLLWVVLSTPGDPTTRLRAIDVDGNVRAEVQIPLELRIFEVGRDYILGAYEEATGEPHVAQYRLHRGR